MDGGQASSAILDDESNIIRIHGLAPAGSGAAPAAGKISVAGISTQTRIVAAVAALVLAAGLAILAGVPAATAIGWTILAGAAAAGFRRFQKGCDEEPVTSPNCWPQGW
jgi:hypothetical protein